MTDRWCTYHQGSASSGTLLSSMAAIFAYCATGTGSRAAHQLGPRMALSASCLIGNLNMRMIFWGFYEESSTNRRRWCSIGPASSCVLGLIAILLNIISMEVIFYLILLNKTSFPSDCFSSFGYSYYAGTFRNLRVLYDRKIVRRSVP